MVTEEEIREIKKKIFKLGEQAKAGDDDAYSDLFVLLGYIEVCCEAVSKAVLMLK